MFPGADFLLDTDVAADLYRRVAEPQPIIDYHTHLSPEQIATNHRFRSITEAWLDGDHYKWRAMRANGIDERLITGPTSDWEKFEAWARTVPMTLRNPLYHWTHMELHRPFGVDALLSPGTAREIYDRCNARLSEDAFTTRGLLKGFGVTVICTTDDPADSLSWHQQMSAEPDPATRMYPTWRPDRALAIEDPAAFNAWVARLEAAAGASVSGSYRSLLDALDRRHRAFHALGCRASDHGLETVWAAPWTDERVDASFNQLRSGKALDPVAARAFKSALLHDLAVMDHSRGWVQQFHLGALRNTNTRRGRILGADTGCDSIGDWEQSRALAALLDSLDATGQLAKTILYNLNPADNEVFATMAGNYQDGQTPGKMQFGAAWWFLDQLDGMTAQLNALSNMGLLARFVGMITDSRSFLSYSRHEYFRRLLCHLLGDDVRRGLLPDDRALLGQLVENVCYLNAREYFGFAA
jgi:glucuronate isomerase